VKNSSTQFAGRNLKHEDIISNHRLVLFTRENNKIRLCVSEEKQHITLKEKGNFKIVGTITPEKLEKANEITFLNEKEYQHLTSIYQDYLSRTMSFIKEFEKDLKSETNNYDLPISGRDLNNFH